MDWHHSASITPTGELSFSATVDERWGSLKGAHGGIVAALAVEAVEAVIGREGAAPAATLRAATFGYAAPNDIGDFVIDVEVIRRGRSMVTTHARVLQNGTTTTVGRLHHSTPRTGLEFSDARPQPIRPPGTVRIEPPSPAHFRNVEAYLDPATSFFGGAERAEWRAWSRPIHGDVVDTSWLTMFGDYFAPSVFARTEAPIMALTIEYSFQIHDGAGRWTLGADEFLAARMHTFHSHDGFAVEDGEIHLPDGTLLATVRQTRLAG